MSGPGSNDVDVDVVVDFVKEQDLFISHFRDRTSEHQLWKSGRVVVGRRKKRF